MFTHTATNPIENHLGCRPYPETLHPKKKIETLYPKTFESATILCVNGSKRKFELIRNVFRPRKYVFAVLQ